MKRKMNEGLNAPVPPLTNIKPHIGPAPPPPSPMTKQISRDDVSRLAAYLFGMGTTGADIGCTDRTKIREAAAMLRSLMDELEEATVYWKKLAVMEADARTRAEKAEAQLAAANERAQVIENDMEMALLLLEQAEPPKENDDDQEWAATVGSLASAYRGD